MKTYQTLATVLDGRILTVRLNRPDKLNAFTIEMGRELEDLIRAASEDDGVGAIIVTGEGRAFCAGMELTTERNAFGMDETLRPTLADMADLAAMDGAREPAGRLNLAIMDCKKPVIAAINGAAVGVGATMTLAMDFRLATADAKIGFVFGKLGIVPEGGSSWLLPRLVGPQLAMEWALTADFIGAEDARAGGLLRSVHADQESLLAAATELARKIVDGRSPVAIALTCQMMRRNPGLESLDEVHRVESLAIFYTSIGDGKEGVKAFVEKRAPEFTGRASDMPPFYPWWE